MYENFRTVGQQISALDRARLNRIWYQPVYVHHWTDVTNILILSFSQTLPSNFDA